MTELGFRTDLGSVQLAFPLLVEALVLIAAVAEGAHGANIEVVLLHAYAGLPRLERRLVQYTLVHLQQEGYV